ncbi:hypothetical protein B0T25DRAFT_569424 [Lasiosphaeria hispida]|uniref:Uncharacterized protein n=1 Tax=Lasiosphaeria hispida TaxID=260671 RepID=A0AAJ0HDT5_9PEZI|nr:hypothetical protein B0T25DRAFT_569424 [Lasiosphaeria hispida]
MSSGGSISTTATITTVTAATVTAATATAVTTTTPPTTSPVVPLRYQSPRDIPETLADGHDAVPPGLGRSNNFLLKSPLTAPSKTVLELYAINRVNQFMGKRGLFFSRDGHIGTCPIDKR